MPMRPKIAGPTLGGGGLKCLRDQLMEDGAGSGEPGRKPFLRRGEGRLGMETVPGLSSYCLQYGRPLLVCLGGRRLGRRQLGRWRLGRWRLRSGKPRHERPLSKPSKVGRTPGPLRQNPSKVSRPLGPHAKSVKTVKTVKSRQKSAPPRAPTIPPCGRPVCETTAFLVCSRYLYL